MMMIKKSLFLAVVCAGLLIPCFASAQMLGGIASDSSEGTNGGGPGYSLKVHISAGGASTATTTAIDTTGADLIVVFVSGDSSPTLSDSKSNTWLTAIAHHGSYWGTIYYCRPPSNKVGTGHTFTETSTYGTIEVTAWSGSASSPLDQTNGADSYAVTSTQPGSINAVNRELIITGWLSDQSYSSLTINSSFTIDDSQLYSSGTNFGGGMAYRIENTTEAVNPTWSWTSSINSLSAIASFKAQ